MHPSKCVIKNGLNIYKQLINMSQAWANSILLSSRLITVCELQVWNKRESFKVEGKPRKLKKRGTPISSRLAIVKYNSTECKSKKYCSLLSHDGTSMFKEHGPMWNCSSPFPSQILDSHDVWTRVRVSDAGTFLGFRPFSF